MECDNKMAGWLRTEVAAAEGQGYDHFEFNLFDIELFYAEGRVIITDACSMGYADVEVPPEDFVAALPDVPVGERMPGRPRRVFPMPPSPE